MEVVLIGPQAKSQKAPLSDERGPAKMQRPVISIIGSLAPEYNHQSGAESVRFRGGMGPTLEFARRIGRRAQPDSPLKALRIGMPLHPMQVLQSIAV